MMFIFDTHKEAADWTQTLKRGKRFARVCCLFRGSVWNHKSGDTAVWRLSVEQTNGDGGCSIMSVGGRSREELLASMFGQALHV